MKTIGKKKKRKKAVKKSKQPALTGGTDKVWIGEQDARTLADAETILGDPKRKKEAVKQAKKMAAEKMAQARAMENVAKNRPVKKPKKSKKKEAAFSE